MINIELVLYGHIGEQLGLEKTGMIKTVNLKIKEGSSVQELIVYISKLYPKFREIGLKEGTDELLWNMAILINGNLCNKDTFCVTILQEEDKVVLMPVYVGG